MTVLRLDHINVRSKCMAESIRFYTEILGMQVRPPYPNVDIMKAAYVYAESERAIVHLIATEKFIDAPLPEPSAAQNGVVNHVALQCRDADKFIARFKQHGIEHNEQILTDLKMHLIFLRDPNGIMIELSF